MILQALKDYYARKADDPSSGIAPEGWEWREFEFLAVFDEEGNFACFQEMQEGDGRLKRGRRYLVPSLGEKKGSGIKSNLLWENVEYMFGVPVPTKQKPSPDQTRVRKQHEAFVERLVEVEGGGPSLEAARKISRRNDLADLLNTDSLWPEIIAKNPFLLLSIRGKGPVTDDPIVRRAIGGSKRGENERAKRRCLVSGDLVETANLEPPIKGVRGAQSTGASLVSFNLSAFESFGKEQGENAPIGKSASCAYAAALNHLLGRDSPQRLQVGDATTVFWSERDHELEKKLAFFFDEPPKDDP
ncbi:type I-C CRISPR-associated protein Cas8c/Csd1, partial [Candidatus Sumerlaeota bacterium]|nr:type I-C CRISPR-associated protein Cas8c/Csd1 [Candidatus Sumerlaeota bacterium]